VPDDDPNEIVAGNIRRFRTQRNWTHKQLAETAGIAASNVTFLEHGQRRGLSQTFCRIVRAFGMPAWVLLHPNLDIPCPTCGGAPPDGFICATCHAPWLEVLGPWAQADTPQ
jgi:transcriptional regulator with XRE-family HTH domain